MAAQRKQFNSIYAGNFKMRFTEKEYELIVRACIIFLASMIAVILYFS